jgi:hypothetical protein
MPRPKGVPNKPKRALLALLQERYPGYHPVLKMVEIAHSPDSSLELQAQMHKEVARYVEPVLQAVAVGHDTESGPLQVTVRIVPHA